MRSVIYVLLAHVFLSGCAVRSNTAATPSSLLRLGIAPETTICQGMRRVLGLSASWAAGSSPDASRPPEITWMSQDQKIVNVGRQSGAITGVSPGRTTLIVHARAGDAFGRSTTVVTVLPGEHDVAASQHAGELVCGSG